MSLKNFLPKLVLTFKLKCELNQITFLFRFRLVFLDDFLNFSVAWYPLFLSAVSYIILALLNLASSQDKLEMRFLVIDGNCLMIDGGWLYFECIYRSVLFGFLKGKYFPVFKFKEISKKSVSMRFVSIVIDSPSSLNKLIMSFLNLSTLGPLALCTMASPSSLYKPTLLEPKRGLILFRRYNPTRCNPPLYIHSKSNHPRQSSNNCHQ